MTEKLFYTDSHQQEFTAEVVSCRPCDNGYEAVLSRTAFFPEGGGQAADTGVIDGIRVYNVQEKGEQIFHYLEGELEEGKTVTGQIDWDKRFSRMQQHSGEHILSGMASKLFGAKNVGFHMAEDYATIDLDTQLTHEQIKELQREANRAVQRNVPVTYETVQGEELEHITLRKQAKGLKGDIRIVYFDGGEVDSCTCCGTHVAFSGEVGYIKITAHIKYKGGTRIWFACGMRAVEDSLNNQDIVDSLAVRFSAKQEDVLNAVLRQGDELTAARHQLKERTEKLNEFIAAELLGKAEVIGATKLIIDMHKGSSMNELKNLGDMLIRDENVLAMLFGENGDSLVYQLARGRNVKTSMRELIKAVNAAAGGKGGGRDEYAQGSAKITSATDAEGSIESLRGYCRSMLKA